MLRIGLTVLLLAGVALARPRRFANTSTDDYWIRRNEIVLSEKKQALGGSLEFEDGEEEANEILMAAKFEEIAAGFERPAKFPPARNFLEAKEDIERSRVFQILRKMPKGGVLHLHDSAIASFDSIYNITFEENLYVCDVNDTLKLRFFNEPNEECEWKLLSEVRKNEELAELYNERIRSQLSINRAYSNDNTAWKKFREIFTFIAPILGYKPMYEKNMYRGLQEHYDDNVMYMEMRSVLPTIYDLNGTTYSYMDTVRLHKEITDRFKRDHPDFVGLKLIYAPSRHISSEAMDTYIEMITEMKKEYPDFIAGFDLVGQEDKGESLRSFAEKLRALNPDIKFMFHAGETKWNGLSVDDNLVDAVLLNTTRIGHGYALPKHPRVMDMVIERDIAIEVNPISNQVLGFVKDLRNHPASLLFAKGFPVVVSNDDPGLWSGKGLSYDFYEAFMGIMSKNSDLRALKQLAINSLKYSSLSYAEKQRALDSWREKWKAFVRDLTTGNREGS